MKVVFNNQVPRLTVPEQFAVRDAFWSCKSMTDPNKRQTIVSLLTHEGGSISRDDTGRGDVLNIVRWCLDQPYGIQELFESVRGAFESDSVNILNLISILGPLFCSIFGPPLNGITNEYLDDLKKILHDVELNLEDVRMAFEIGGLGVLSCPSYADPEREYRALVWRVATAPQLPSGHLPIIGFTQELGRYVPSIRAQLEKWATHVATQLHVAPARQYPGPTVHELKDPCLQIIVEVDDVDAEDLAMQAANSSSDAHLDTFFVSAQLWLNDTEADCRYFDKHATTLRSLPLIVNQFLGKCQECIQSLTIEVFLPYALLKRYPVEEWSIKNTGFGTQIYLSDYHPLVLRSSTRIEAISLRVDWRARWQHLRSLDQATLLPSDALVWMWNIDLPQLKEHYQAIKKEIAIVGAALLVQPADIDSRVDDEGGELLARLLMTGLPLLIWGRKDILAADAQYYRTPIYATVPNRVPQIIREQRKNDSQWRNVALLWDNPERIPAYFEGYGEAPQTDRRP
jgi:hypothetical protein